MRTGFAIALAVIAASAIGAPAQAQYLTVDVPTLPVGTCAFFRHNADGSWTTVRDIDITSSNGSVRLAAVRDVLVAGLPRDGIDIGTALDRQCIRAP
jgi:predicted phosphoribosyltransferase